MVATAIQTEIAISKEYCGHHYAYLWPKEAIFFLCFVSWRSQVCPLLVVGKNKLPMLKILRLKPTVKSQENIKPNHSVPIDTLVEGIQIKKN